MSLPGRDAGVGGPLPLAAVTLLPVGAGTYLRHHQCRWAQWRCWLEPQGQKMGQLSLQQQHHHHLEGHRQTAADRCRFTQGRLRSSSPSLCTNACCHGSQCTSLQAPSHCRPSPWTQHTSDGPRECREREAASNLNKQKCCLLGAGEAGVSPVVPLLPAVLLSAVALLAGVVVAGAAPPPPPVRAVSTMQASSQVGWQALPELFWQQTLAGRQAGRRQG